MSNLDKEFDEIQQLGDDAISNLEALHERVVSLSQKGDAKSIEQAQSIQRALSDVLMQDRIAMKRVEALMQTMRTEAQQ